MDRYGEARRGNQDTAFRLQVLEYLERIAIALENPLTKVQPHEEPLQPLVPQAEAPIIYNRDANVCLCGNDPKRHCSECTPARMAWFLNMNPGYLPPQ